MKRVLVLDAAPKDSKASSYLFGFPKAFKETTVFDANVVNVVTHNPFQERFVRWKALAMQQYDVVILLHSVFSAALKLPCRWQNALKDLGVPIVYFIANEYYRLPQKMAFAEDLGVKLLVSQCFSENVLKLYSDRLGCKAIGLPNTGFDTSTFPPGEPVEKRPIDIGYRMAPGPASLGHWEREDIAAAISAAANSELKLDISMRPEDRFGLDEWRRFLQSCKTQLSVASGGDIFELDDRTLLKVDAFVKEHPNASREEISRCYPPVSERIPLRTLSSRMVEAASTKTVQIMYPADIGMPLEPDIHYIRLNKNHDNIHDVIERVSDHKLLSTISENAFELMREFLSYDRIMLKLDSAIDQVLNPEKK